MSSRSCRLSCWRLRVRLQSSQIMLFIFKLFLIQPPSLDALSPQMLFFLSLLFNALLRGFSGCLEEGCFVIFYCLPLQFSSRPMFLDQNPSLTTLTPLDLQYSICSQFLKLTTEHLSQKELVLLQRSSKFIEKVTENLGSKEVSTTQDSLDSPNDEEDNFVTHRPRLTLSRSRSNATLRRSDNGITQALLQVQRVCSQKTAGTVGSLVAEGRRARQKVLVLDRLQRELKKNQSKAQACQAELILLRKKNLDLETTNRDLEAEVVLLRQKMRQAREQLDCARDQLQEKGPETAHTEGLKKYLEDRELQMARKERELRQIQEKIESAISAPGEGGCERCCQMVRKIKESVVAYRRFLEEEAALAQALYHNYKSLFS